MTKLSRDERFKIWRSKQPYSLNIIIDFALFLKDMLVLLLMGIIAMAIIVGFILLLIQVTGNAYSG